VNARNRLMWLPAAAILATMLAAGCGDSSSGADNNSAAASEGAALTGKQLAAGMPLDILYDTLGDKQAGKKLKVTSVYCGWNSDGHVVLHADFKNGLNAHVTVHVQPEYKLANAGKHGNGMANLQDVGLDANASREWVGDLGTPAGVNGTPKITGCMPKVGYVELG
jgi:hypothetical protein